MGDMNTLLLVFFVMLFTMMMTDKGRAGVLHEALSSAAPATATLFDDGPGEFRQVKGRTLRVQRLAEGISVTMGSEGAPFAEGSWTLSQDQKEILDVVKAELVGTRKRIEIRGHTSGNVRDSVVLDGAYRAFDPSRDRDADADWIMLATLRAREVCRYLAASIPDVRLRIRADGWSRWIEPSGTWNDRRVRNQRVEIVLTNEDVRKP